MRHVLVPLDGSALAEAVLPAVQDLLGDQPFALTLLRVVTPTLEEVPVYPGWGPVGDWSGALPSTEEQVAAARAYLEEVRRRLPQGGEVHLEVRVGAPAPAILQVAQEERADLIAMATHGRGGIARAVLGSITDLVLRMAPVPVLVVRPQPGSQGGRRPG